ncbi:MAG: hypothetical protein ABIP78_05795 [Pyrinomonadaceae bacterium]
MKHCPKCNQIYSDESLNFCLDDGSLLIAPNLSEPTVVMGSEFRGSTPISQKGINSSIAYIAIGLLALVAGGAIVAFLMSRSAPTANVASGQTPTTSTNIISNVANVKPIANRAEEVVEYPDSRPEPLTAESVKNLISVWERAQENKSFASYQACYDSSFVGLKKTKSGHSQSYSYASWMADRRRMIASSVNLSVDISNLQIRVQGDSALAQFDQYYRSLKYSDWGTKEITVKMTPAGPKIVREELKASYPL